MSDEQELAACPNPWCEGSSPVVNQFYCSDGHEDWVVRCKTCDLFATICSTEAEAITAWNTRHTTDTVDRAAVLEPLNEALDICVQYADFIRADVRADDLERHPYVPGIEDVVLRGTAAIRALSTTPPRQVDEGPTGRGTVPYDPEQLGSERG